ncbi:tRNA (adenosine(37)-N6)-threonylcarbamoyltransferase complex dimerization subunit type 1 TsaB [Limnobacter humi]|uniref:tRNA (Adenosine(37)-N6)-threonylcarbamoyltransferase complex dimerization subunit type 1 TsaB n=1 Tax=Limnobacter humi TaxID=1778671 RepID=A0ABT1WFD1_9BURK|nr:tRNA (adenosine(37)-N6)-threonylcarbamoyltransferase complex dimerization subunit type 1 TsaB [Limnobacter humi]MCQ8896220.1 tRNA (adenosine(37)-N6)-threonylcarbamoyltransferase complex dimerization subunit type 1 TsaB [Limnobacter humi]
MIALGISTSSGVAKVAAVQQAEANAAQHSLQGFAFNTCFEFSIEDYKAQSVELLPRLSQALAGHGLALGDLTVLAVDIGPGGFTSLRTACGVVQGLAVALGKPTVPVTSFECMAVQARLDGVRRAEASQLPCVLDARLGELYVGVVDLQAHGVSLKGSAALCAWVDLNAWVDRQAYQTSPLALCDAAVAKGLTEHEGEHPGVLPAWVVQTAGPSALAAAALGGLRWQLKQTSEPLACQPLYVRDKVAQTTAERQAVKHGPV